MLEEYWNNHTGKRVYAGQNDESFASTLATLKQDFPRCGVDQYSVNNVNKYVTINHRGGGNLLQNMILCPNDWFVINENNGCSSWSDDSFTANFSKEKPVFEVPEYLTKLDFIPKATKTLPDLSKAHGRLRWAIRYTNRGKPNLALEKCYQYIDSEDQSYIYWGIVAEANLENYSSREDPLSAAAEEIMTHIQEPALVNIRNANNIDNARFEGQVILERMKPRA